MRQSTRWKALERSVAARLGARRHPRWLNFGEVAADVYAVVGAYRLIVDCKAHRRFSHHSLMENIATKYCEPGEIPVLVSKGAGQVGEYATIPFSFLAALLDEVRNQPAPDSPSGQNIGV